jgi:hypothetical protein
VCLGVSHPERQEWLVMAGQQYSLYSPVNKSALPGYPRMIHNDAVDGGTNGMNRTRCSGITDLSSMIGFIEDKSPSPSFRAMPYGQNLDCTWVITIPNPMLKQPTGGVSIQWSFLRFDLGPDAVLTVDENMDMPLSVPNSAYNYFLQGDWNPNWYTSGAFDSVPSNTTGTSKKRLATYTQANPPSAFSPTLTTPLGRSSAASLSITVRFTTGTANSATTGNTGFQFNWAVATPPIQTYTALFGVLW